MNAPKPRTRRTPHATAERAQAAAALQRALDRRDNGGVTGHQDGSVGSAH
ncbi:hypothetical protein [Streptacidiphilus fuscans]|uniref:Uncharacterized protein n=1 Tax=Streptacidiphilus fuscans TaxID=2789292 RepID=A0A931AZ33_9ACTN|nr:hypothetical protein [Streptacidiphilus fuscans]MBF9067361.1 hypothetical protein [Streptacidiphilus fuscans]